MEDWKTTGSEMIRNTKSILVFSGAGLSTESGIPDFRSPGGVWDKYDPSEFYFDKFVSSEASRVKYWKMSREFYGGMRDARPNSAHLAVKRLEDQGRLLSIVTQNVDHLHQKAGNSPDRIIEIHGTVFTVSCLSCGNQYGRDDIEERLESGVEAPYCDACAGILKPDTVSFGQAMPQDKMALAMEHAAACDLCLVLGSSLVVYPAASVPYGAARGGAALIIVNRDPTPLDDQADLVVHESVSKVLDAIIPGT